MAKARKSLIDLGFVSIPISIITTVQDKISLNQLHKADHKRIKYKKVCGNCGLEVNQNDIVRGYQYAADSYVTITDTELKNIKPEKIMGIKILHFARQNKISPVLFDKAYYVVPDVGGDKALETLRRVLIAEQKIAIGKTVMESNQKLIALIPWDDGVLLQTMYFVDEVLNSPKYNKPEVSEQELKMAKSLINSIDAQFNPGTYHDEYQMKLHQLIEGKIIKKGILN